MSIAAMMIEIALAALVFWVAGPAERRMRLFLAVLIVTDIFYIILFATGAGWTAFTYLYYATYSARYLAGLWVVLPVRIDLWKPMGFSTISVAAVLYFRPADTTDANTFLGGIVCLFVFLAIVAVEGAADSAGTARARYAGLAVYCVFEVAAQLSPWLAPQGLGEAINLLEAELVGGALLLMAFLYSGAQREGGWSPMRDASPLKHALALIDIDTLRRRLR